MTPEFGAASQLEKIDMLDFADFVAINKFDRKGAQDALRDVRKQYQRNRELFGRRRPTRCRCSARSRRASTTTASPRSTSALAAALRASGLALAPGALPAVATRQSTQQRAIVPAARVRYLAEIAETVRGYHGRAERTGARSRASGSSCGRRKAMLAGKWARARRGQSGSPAKFRRNSALTRWSRRAISRSTR